LTPRSTSARAALGRVAVAITAGVLAFGCSSPEDAATTGEAFPNRREPFVLPEGDFGITSDNGSDTLTLLDLEALTVIGAAPVGRDPVDRDGPHHLALDRAAGVVFVALAYPVPPVAPGPHAAHGASQRAGYVQKLALDDLRPLAEARVETNPGDIVLSEDGKLLAVSHFDLERALRNRELDPNAGDLAPRLVTTCVAPHAVALSRPRGEFAFVACYGEDALAVVATGDPEAEPERVSVGPGGSPGSPLYGPYAAVLSNGGELVAVSNTLSGDVRLFSTAERVFRDTPLVPTGTPFFAAWSDDDRVLFVPTQNADGLEAFDAESGERLRRRSFAADECTLPHEVTFGSDPARLFVVCEGDHETPSVVLALDSETLETVATLPVGVYPDRLVVGRRAR
jgi:DNA-binding beta-propeller fold protein YncE